MHAATPPSTPAVMPRLTSFRRSSSSSSSIDDSTLDGPPCAVEVRGAGSSMADGTYLLTTNEMDGAPVNERDRGAWRLLRMHLPSGTHWLVVTRGGTWYRCRSELPTPPCGRGVRWETGTDGARPVPTFTAVLPSAGLTRPESGPALSPFRTCQGRVYPCSDVWHRPEAKVVRHRARPRCL